MVPYVEQLGSLLPLGEKRRLLNQLLAQVRQESEVNEFLKECEQCSSNEYNWLKDKLAERFHRDDLIIELLRTGDKTIMSKAINKPWIYEVNRKLLSNSDFLLNQLFPNVSWSSRQRVIGRIGHFIQSEKLADNICNAVTQKYGISAAVPLLQACTKEKLNSVLSMGYVVKLRDMQIKKILQKYPDIGLAFLRDHLKHLKDPTKQTPIINYRRRRRVRSSMPSMPLTSLHYLINHRPNEFLDLFMEHSDKIRSLPSGIEKTIKAIGRGFERIMDSTKVESLHLGKKRTIKLIRSCRQKVVHNSKKLRKLIQFENFRKEFSNQEIEWILESSLDDNPDQINVDEMWKFFRTISREERLSVAGKIFYRKYQIHLDEHPEYMNAESMLLVSDERRLTVVEWMIKNKPRGWSFNDMQVCHYDDVHLFAWCVFKPISHSIPELRKLLLSEQEMFKRASLSKSLILTCFMNRDLAELHNVLVLLSNRSRNDQDEVREEIFTTIRFIMEDMEFGKEHWEIIKEMIEVGSVFDDRRVVDDRIIKKCIAFHLKLKLPTEDILDMLIQIAVEDSSAWTNPYIDNVADTKNLLQMYVHRLPILYPDGIEQSYHSSQPHCIIPLLEEISRFNRVQMRNLDGFEPIRIGLQPWWKNSLEVIAKTHEDFLRKEGKEKYSGLCDNAVQSLKALQKLKTDQSLALTLDNLISSEVLSSLLLQSTPNEAVCSYFLLKNPLDLQRQWKRIFLKILATKSRWLPRFMGKIKNFNYTTLHSESLEICKEIFTHMKEGDSTASAQVKLNTLVVLSLLLDSTDFAKRINPYLPDNPKFDINSENGDEDYQIRVVIAKSLMYIAKPDLALTVIEKFCVGDYLKATVGSLYSVACKATETKCLEFLRPQLHGTRVSLHKHIVRLFFKISSIEDKSRVLKDLQSSNVTIRLEIFLQTRNLLKLNPSTEALNIVTSAMESITAEDTPSVQHLEKTPSFDDCPTEFLSYYVQLCMMTFRRVKPESLKTFMDHLTKLVDRISEDVLQMIIKDMDQESFNLNFCVNYIVKSSSASILSQRLSLVWCIVQDVIRNNWNQSDLKPARQLVFSFIEALCKSRPNGTYKLELKKQILQFLLIELEGGDEEKVFKEILYVKFGLMLIDETEREDCEKLKAFGRKASSFGDSLVEKYGGEVTFMFNNTLSLFIDACLHDELIKTSGIIVELVDGMMEASTSRYNQILSLAYLQNINPKADHLIATLEKVRSKLNNSEDTVIQLYREFLFH